LQRSYSSLSIAEALLFTVYCRGPSLHCLLLTPPYLGQHWEVKLPPWGDILLGEEEGGVRRGEGVLTVQLSSQMVPILQTNLENFLLLHF